MGQRWLCQSWSRLGVPTAAVLAKVCGGFVGWWLVRPSTGLFQFEPNCFNQNAKRYLQNSSATGGKSVATALEILFSKLVLRTVSHIFERLSCSLKFALVFYILLQGGFKVVYCEAPLVVLRQSSSSRKKDVKDICYSRLHLFLLLDFSLTAKKISKIQLNITKLCWTAFFDDYILLSKTSTSKSAAISAESLFVVVLVAQLVSRHSCVADRLPVVVRFPAGPRVRLKTVDPPKGNGLGQKKNLLKVCLDFLE